MAVTALSESLQGYSSKFPSWGVQHSVGQRWSGITPSGAAMGICGRAASGVVSSATMVTGAPQCGQSRWAAGCGSGADGGAGAAVGGGGAKGLIGWLVRSTSRRAAAVRLHCGEQ